ncbi:hypothetical protein KP509_28G043000 [Ceratopteris richardii]|uniref:serine O-acetyltransferase n=1 Tax=Ceratopteris richardii TaxID=49495 RepID=A0A8T2RDD6_CERRI|nr:hypothetical protein KP509_28G043000 [Ceratopteris richardii]
MDVAPCSVSADAVWREIQSGALQMSREESEFLSEVGGNDLLNGILHETIFRWQTMLEALAALLASKLGSEMSPSYQWRPVLYSAFVKGSSVLGIPIQDLIVNDIKAIKERDPACPSLAHAFLFFKGFHGIEVHRAANWLWRNQRKSLASLLQSRVSEIFGMDIHPAAQLGSSIMIDHATGVVIGETTKLGDGCTLLHGVSLGGNGKQQGDRHPKLGMNVLVGAGASILGNVVIGNGAKIGASAVVLTDIPAFATAVGCPAKVIGRVKEDNPASALDHSYNSVNLKSQSNGPLFSRLSGLVDGHGFSDQLQNICGLEVPKEEAMALFFEQQRRSLDSHSRKHLNEAETRRIQYGAPACVCST